MALTEQQAPFTESYSKPNNTGGFKSKGNTAMAVKRALAHLKFMPWQPELWDYTYGATVYDAAAAWKRKRGIIAGNSTDGSWGEKAHSVMRQTWFEKDGQQLPPFDSFAQDLLQKEKAGSVEPPDDNVKRVRDALVEFANRGVAAGSRWNYNQARPIDVSIDPGGWVTSDCSGSVIQAYHWARQITGVNVPDPSKYGYGGWGNTWDDEDGWPKVTDGKYLIGDLAHYDGHVGMCVKDGSASSSRWWNFGSEPPSIRELNYRSDLRFVVRPPLEAE